MKKYFQKIKQDIQQYQSIYFDYFIINSFISLIIFKLNKITFQIPFIYLFIGILLFVIIFKNYLLSIGNKFKNTYFFNFILFNNFLLKEFIYTCIFTFIESMTFDKKTKLYIFLFFFSFSYLITFFLFYVGIHYHLFFYFLLLFISIFNLIENQYIFTQKNIDDKKLENLNFKNVQTILNIKNTKFNKNQNLFYTQKRYIHFTELRHFIQKNAITIISSTAAGSLLTSIGQYTSVQVQKEQLVLQKEQHNENLTLQREQLALQREQLEFQKQQYNDQKQKDRIIDALNLEKRPEIKMDTNDFWNKIDHNQHFLSLKAEKIEKRPLEEHKSEENIVPILKKHKSNINIEETTYISSNNIKKLSIEDFFI